jgi:hypothetical protein
VSLRVRTHATEIRDRTSEVRGEDGDRGLMTGLKRTPRTQDPI